MAKIIVSLPDKLLELVDEHCEQFKYNRSEFVRYAMRKVLKKEKYDNTSKNKKTN